MQDYLNENYPIFNEKFELLRFIKKGSACFIYKGKFKLGNNNQKYAIKFFYKKPKRRKRR